MIVARFARGSSHRRRLVLGWVVLALLALATFGSRVAAAALNLARPAPVAPPVSAAVQNGSEGASLAVGTGAPRFSAGAGGLVFAAHGDTNLQIRLRGYAQVESRHFFQDVPDAQADAFLLRRARPIFEVLGWGRLQGLMVGELVGKDRPTLRDAFVSYRFEPWLQVRVGKFKPWLGLEHQLFESAFLFIERAFPTRLMPDRDVGVQVQGDVGAGRLRYNAGIFNGTGDGRASSDLGLANKNDVVGRVFARPLLRHPLELARGLEIGVGGSYGEGHGSRGLPNHTGGTAPGYYTDGQRQFFQYGVGLPGATVFADGVHYRLSPQMHLTWRNVGWLGEYAVSAQEVHRTGGGLDAAAGLDHAAWQVAGSWVMTGEASVLTGIVPRHSFAPQRGHWGAFEATVRYAELGIDKGAFPRFANAATSAHRARAWGLGLNWFLSRNVRASVNYYHTTFDGGAAGIVSARDERAVATRVQVYF